DVRCWSLLVCCVAGNRRKAIGNIQRESEAAGRSSLKSRLFGPITRAPGAPSLQFEVELKSLDKLETFRSRPSKSCVSRLRSSEELDSTAVLGVTAELRRGLTGPTRRADYPRSRRSKTAVACIRGAGCSKPGQMGFRTMHTSLLGCRSRVGHQHQPKEGSYVRYVADRSHPEVVRRHGRRENFQIAPGG